jgi:hypothetical protein
VVNYSKSSVTLLRCCEDKIRPAIQQLAYLIAEQPIKYLGIPLTIRRPTAVQLRPLVDNIAGRLPHWMSGLMNKTGRLTMVKSVLSAIPIHQLLVFAPPMSSLKQVERIERGFFWAARAEANGGQCHVNWRRVCRPISLGGLGVRDLEQIGLSLRLRWLRYSRMDDTRAWSNLNLQFSTEERALFFACTSMMVGNGERALFWEDRSINGRSVSEIAPLLYNCIPKRRRKIRTVSDGLQGNCWACDIQGTLGVHEVGQYLLLWQSVQNIHLTDAPDAPISSFGNGEKMAHTLPVPGLLPWIHDVTRLEADMEDLGAT